MPDHRSVQCSLRRVSVHLIGGAFLLGFCVTSHAVAFDAEAALTYDDNVTRAQRDTDILKDKFLAASAGVSFLHPLNLNNRFIYRGFLRYELYDQYDGLSNVALGGQVTYQYRASGEFTSSTYAAFFRGAVNEYDSERRDSNVFSLGASWRKPITDRITVFSQLAGNMRESDSTVFDTREISLLGNVDYAILSRWTAYLTLNYLSGDIVSSANSSVYGTLPLVNAAEAINSDDAFDSAGNWVAYRLNGKTYVATLGTNYSFGEHHSIDFSVRLINSKADGDISYDRLQVTAAYLARF
jgi:hypothetical protein